MLEAVFGLLLQALHTCINGLRERSCADPTGIGMLVEVGLETVLFEHLLIVGRIVGVSVERLVLETIDQQTPPLVARAEVDRAVHRLHTVLREPLTGSVEEHKCQLAVVDRLEKTATTRRLLIVEHCRTAVEECSDTTYAHALLVESQPAASLAIVERVVARGIEDRANIIIEWAYPLRSCFVQTFWQVDKCAFVLRRADHLQCVTHNYKVEFS